MTALFGEKYFGFIASAYGITAFVIVVLVVWSVASYRIRQRDLDRLREQGLARRAETQA